jgi:hypothetical protein
MVPILNLKKNDLLATSDSISSALKLMRFSKGKGLKMSSAVSATNIIEGPTSFRTTANNRGRQLVPQSALNFHPKKIEVKEEQTILETKHQSALLQTPEE